MALSNVAAAASGAASGSLSTRVLARVAPPRPVVIVAKRTGQALGALLVAAGSAVVGTVVYEAQRSSEECAVVPPLRLAAVRSVPGGPSAGLSPAEARAAFVGAAAAAAGLRDGGGGSSTSSAVPFPAMPQEDAAERSCIVIGSGVVGVTTAYVLARRGFEVTVLERRRGAGEEASAVGAGWLSPAELGPEPALITLAGVIRDQLKGLSPWTFFRLWAARADIGVSSGMLRSYVGDLRSEGAPPEEGKVEFGVWARPAEEMSAELRDAAARAASYDASYFVDWSALLSEHVRFAYVFAARAVMELWLGSYVTDEALAASRARQHALQALSQWSTALLQEVLREERLDCPLCFRGLLRVSLGSSWLPRFSTGDEAGDTWDAQRARRELPYAAEAAEAVYRPEGGLGDCGVFTRQLARLCRERYGVKFRYGCEVREMQMDDVEGTGRLIGRVQCADGRRFRASCFVLANGAAAPALAQSIVDKHCEKPDPVHLPVCGVRGFSLTLPVIDVAKAHLQALRRWPCVLFEPSMVRLSSLPGAGSEDAVPVALRFSGVAEVAASPGVGGGMGSGAAAAALAEGHRRRAAVLRRKAADAVPSLASSIERAEVVSALQPQCADDLPIISGTRYPNLFVNVGHGSRGWSLACGSAELLAQLMEADTPVPATTLGAPSAAAPLALAFSLRRFAGAKMLWRAPAPHLESCPELLGSRVGPMELLRMGPAHPPGRHQGLN